MQHCADRLRLQYLRQAWRTHRRVLLLCLGSTVACSHGLASSGHQGSDSSAAIAAVADDYWELLLHESPTWATQLGDRRFDAEWPDISAEARAANRGRKQELVQRLGTINVGFVSREEGVTARFLASLLASDLSRDVCQGELWSVDQLSGWHLAIAGLADFQQVDSPAAVTAYLTRLQRSARLLEQHRANLQQGLKEGYVAPRIAVERVLRQLDAMLAAPQADWPSWGVVPRARNLSPQELESLRQGIAAAVRTAVHPALKQYAEFLRHAYLPLARSKVGVSYNSHGAQCYQALLQDYAGGVREQTPQELHETGRLELARLRQAMLSIAKAEGYASIDAYAAALRQLPEQFLASRDAILAHNRELLTRATAALPNMFAVLPHTTVQVRAVEPFREQDAPAAFYEPAAADGSHPAYYYVNTFNPRTRPLYNMDALAFHEALPGHHLQIALAAQLPDLPRIRRYAGQTTFIEGWGLYAETLADEMGLYQTPATRFGMLNFQAWRAARLVVDTGLHALQWSRDDSLDFMRQNLILPDQEIANEVDRYIVWPGQALAYMSGRMHFQQLRSEAQRKLGARFDIREFHRRVLGEGAIPMSVLRDVIGEWLARG